MIFSNEEIEIIEDALEVATMYHSVISSWRAKRNTEEMPDKVAQYKKVLDKLYEYPATSCLTCKHLKFPKYEPFIHMGEQLHGKCMRGVCNTSVLYTNREGATHTVCLVDGTTLDSFYCTYYTKRRSDETVH